MPLISEETIRRVAEATDIVDLISSYFPLKRSGSTYKALCPFHKEKTPSFHVNPARQTYKCFGCGASGTVFRFLMEYEHIDFPEAVRRLASKAGIPILEELNNSPQQNLLDLKRRLLAIHAAATAWFHHHLISSPDAAAARKYLHTRKISQTTARNWQLGFAPPSSSALLNHLLKEKKFSRDDLLKSGLFIEKDGSQTLLPRFRNRLIFPIRNELGETIAFSGRIIPPDSHPAKYINSPETPIFTKGRILFGLDKSKRPIANAGFAIILEGQLDLIRAFEAGIENVTAAQGTAFTPDQARLLARFTANVTLCFDPDHAGQQAAIRSVPSLLASGISIRVAILPPNEDPDSFISNHGPQSFLSLINSAKDFFDHSLSKAIAEGCLNDPIRTAQIARKLASLASNSHDPIVREKYIAKIAAALQVNPKELAKTQPPPATHNTVHSPSETANQQTQKIHLSPATEILCRSAILEPKARDWLRSQQWPTHQPNDQGWELLQAILSTHENLDSPSHFVVFLSTLPDPLQKALTSLDLDHRPPDLLLTCKACWFGLLKEVIQTQIANLLAQCKSLTNNQDYLTIQKQILDLKTHLQELNQLSNFEDAP